MYLLFWEFFREKLLGRNVFREKCRRGEMSQGEMSPREKCRFGRNVAGRNVAGRFVVGEKCLPGEMSYNLKGGY